MITFQRLRHGELVRSARTLDVIRAAPAHTLATCACAALAARKAAIAAARAAYAGWRSTPSSGLRVARHRRLRRREAHDPQRADLCGHSPGASLDERSRPGASSGTLGTSCSSWPRAP